MTRRTLHRPGVTLTEVLVAMITMAIGMLSLLTLFPLGAMQVAQALRDDRCRQTALQADTYMRSHWRHQVVEELNAGRSPVEPFFWAMDDVNLYETPTTTANPKFFSGTGILNKFFPPAFQLPTSANLPKTTLNSPVSTTMLTGDNFTLAGPPNQAYASAGTPLAFPSYPVMVDPLVEQTWTSYDRYWVGYSKTYSSGMLLPRRQLNVVNTSPANALQIAGMTDDMSFEKNGAPRVVSVGPPFVGSLGRQGRYTWAAIVQRPRNDVRTIANLTILVFDGRSSLPTAGDEAVIYPNATFAKDTRTLTVTVPASSLDRPVLLRRGGWIMDGTLPAGTSVPVTAPQMANYYRITGIVETATANVFDVDIETPLKAAVTTSSQLYLFAGLAEVFERPTMKPDLGYYLP